MVLIRLFVCVWLSGIVLVGCGENTPSEEDYWDIIKREWLGQESSDTQDASMELVTTIDSQEAEAWRSKVIDKYGDRLTGFGYARLVTTVVYKKTISRLRLRTSGDITVHGIAIYQIDGNSHWELFESKYLGGQKLQPTSIEVLEEALKAAQLRLDETQRRIAKCERNRHMLGCISIDHLERDLKENEAEVAKFVKLIEENG